MVLLLVVAVLLIAAASGGFVMARKIWRGVVPPAHLALGHGLLVMPALPLALLAAHLAGSSLAKSAVAVLLAAAVGGVLMLVFRAKGRLPPRALVAAHGLAAGAGILGLVAAAVILF